MRGQNRASLCWRDFSEKRIRNWTKTSYLFSHFSPWQWLLKSIRIIRYEFRFTQILLWSCHFSQGSELLNPLAPNKHLHLFENRVWQFPWTQLVENFFHWLQTFQTFHINYHWITMLLHFSQVSRCLIFIDLRRQVIFHTPSQLKTNRFYILYVWSMVGMEHDNNSHDGGDTINDFKLS